MNNVAMVNVQSLLNGKDSRWLQLEVCREFQRGKCSRQDHECKYAHPAQNVEVQNGRVTACYDSIKGRCTRENPPCKYFHPPQHLKDQLLINGRNHLALKNAILQQLGMQPGQPGLPTMPLVSGTLVAPPASTSYLDTLPYHQITHPYLTGFTQLGGTMYNPYLGGSAAGMLPTVGGHDGLTAHTLPAVMQAPVMTPPAAQPATQGQKLNRTDRLEAGPVYKRPAGEKSGMPVYQSPASSTAAYQQALMTLQQPFVPMSCEYPGTNSIISNGDSNTTITTASSTTSNNNNSLVPSTSKAIPSPALYTGVSLNKQTPPTPMPPPVLPVTATTPYWNPYLSSYLPPTFPQTGFAAASPSLPYAGGMGMMGQVGALQKLLPPPPPGVSLQALQNAKKA